MLIILLNAARVHYYYSVLDYLQCYICATSSFASAAAVCFQQATNVAGRKQNKTHKECQYL